jgi:hypothetical protein
MVAFDAHHKNTAKCSSFPVYVVVQWFLSDEVFPGKHLAL